MYVYQVFSTLNPEEMEKDIQGALKVDCFQKYLKTNRYIPFFALQEASRMYNKKEDPVALRFKVSTIVLRLLDFF